ncbi:hypothetical protein F945_01633 [Acinetobacter rudis CIP 110305]|uniref:DUF2474 domain-containing protein n=1 Tax=Acinetobacter rudis CIP 110305 TaxID=421052 RepID=S3P610_9GAMM|nr:hypothetical protein [Acinetobacter rudis]EPF74266.1 hypothetical protein F945_01633 [Acinetobacter rudis CIP 110305]
MLHKRQFNLSSMQWFVLLWIVGFVGLAIIAGLFKIMLYFAY